MAPSPMRRLDRCKALSKYERRYNDENLDVESVEIPGESESYF